MAKSVSRLFNSFQPEHYQLALTPDAKTLTFSGRVIIRGQKVGRPSKRVVFHQKDLKITEAEVIHQDKKGRRPVAIARINHHEAYDEVRLHAGTMLYPGTYEVTLRFEGTITRNMQGIYPSFFKHKGQEKIILSTQFESHHAREAFPCIDEPEAKATFELQITAPKDLTILSNTPETGQQAAKGQPGLAQTTFQTTPRMPTYLLAFTIGELHSVEATSKAGVKVRSWASVAQPKSHLQYSADEAANVLDFFADYFGVPFPLPKLDQVALPDFEAAAMENWGIVTYREIALLADPNNRSISNEQFLTLVISHELSHQWFGNLVTMRWWDDLWLNESFAGLMEHVAPAALHPEWQQWELYTISDIPLITSRDSYKDIQPVGVSVTDPDLIPTLFDPAIVYSKGARLLKMLREYIGEDTFIKGLRAYFAKHAYSNATREDLWAALSKASGQDIAALMTPWLVQPGMPVVHVNQTKTKLEVKQERFLLDGQPDGSTWPIPLLADQALQPDVLTRPSANLTVKSQEPVIVNYQASGQFITHYQNAEHRRYIIQALSQQRLPTPARINILNDAYMLTRHGYMSLPESLDMVVGNQNEPRDTVWGIMIRLVAAAAQLTEGDKAAEEQLNALKISLAHSKHTKLGWDDKPGDDPNTKQLRHTMAALMVGGEDAGALKQALGRYKAGQKDLQNIPAEVRNTILGAAVRHGSPGNVQALLDVYNNSSPEVQLDITGAVASTRDPAVAKKVLSQALGPKGFVRTQDVLRWLVVFLRNHHVRQIAWDFMLDNWDWLESSLRSGKYFDFLPTYAAAFVSDEKWAQKYRDLFEPKQNDKILQRNIKIGLGDIEARVAWRQRDEAAVKQWLAANTE